MEDKSKSLFIYIYLGAKSEKIFKDFWLLYSYSKYLYIFILDAKPKYLNTMKNETWGQEIIQLSP